MTIKQLKSKQQKTLLYIYSKVFSFSVLGGIRTPDRQKITIVKSVVNLL